MSEFIKAEKVVATSLGLLRRELILPRLMWQDAKIDPTLSLDDTVTIRLPAYLEARTRALRGGAARTKSSLFERKVNVTLDTDIYLDVPITDEQLTLDISDLGGQVLNPMTLGIADKLEQEGLDIIEGATYAQELEHDLSSDSAYETVVDAGTALDDARIPPDGRFLVVGSAFAAAIMKDPQFSRVSYAGTDQTLRKGMIGEIAGFQVFKSGGLAPDLAIAFHRTAFCMVNRAPIVPDGAPWGAVSTYAGLALRTVRVFDADAVQDRMIMDSWFGGAPVLDDGYWDSQGKWVPTTEPGETTGPGVTLATSAHADDIIDTATAHDLEAGDKVRFTALTGGTGLTTGTDYYVIAANLAATTFQVSTTPGGSAALFSADITAGTVAKLAVPQLVRAVKITCV